MQLTDLSRTKEIVVNLSPAGAHNEKNSAQKILAEKKCTHRTETGFCKRSNRQCPLFNV
jgi:hypothetical protein